MADTDVWPAWRIIEWVLGAPEKAALGMVVLAGAAQWWREWRARGRGDRDSEDLIELLLNENRELRAENRALMRELRLIRRNGGHTDER